MESNLSWSSGRTTSLSSVSRLSCGETPRHHAAVEAVLWQMLPRGFYSEVDVGVGIVEGLSLQRVWCCEGCLSGAVAVIVKGLLF